MGMYGKFQRTSSSSPIYYIGPQYYIFCICIINAFYNENVWLIALVNKTHRIQSCLLLCNLACLQNNWIITTFVQLLSTWCTLEPMYWARPRIFNADTLVKNYTYRWTDETLTDYICTASAMYHCAGGFLKKNIYVEENAGLREISYKTWYWLQEVLSSLIYFITNKLYTLWTGHYLRRTSSRLCLSLLSRLILFTSWSLLKP